MFLRADYVDFCYGYLDVVADQMLAHELTMPSLVLKPVSRTRWMIRGFGSP